MASPNIVPQQQQGEQDVKSGTTTRRSKVAEQTKPVVHVIGKIAGGGDKDPTDGSGTRYLIRTGWTDKTYQLSVRGLKVLRNMDLEVVDDPAEYSI